MIHNQIKKQLELFDWFYHFSDDPGVFAVGKEKKKKLFSLLQNGLKSSYLETNRVIQEFLAEKKENCDFGDFHFYLSPIQQVYSSLNLKLER